MAETTAGRPRQELTDAQRVELVELGGRVKHLEAEARQARAELVKLARQALKAGASHRAVGEAVGVSRHQLRHMVDAGGSG
jgi:hypothetical protein